MSSSDAGDAFTRFERPPHAPGDEPRRIESLLVMTRAGNAALAALGVLVGALAGGGHFGFDPTGLQIIAAMAVGYLGTAGGNVLNDLVDHDLDRTAHPERPLPRGRVNRSDARRFLYLVWGLTLAVAALVGAYVLVYAAVAILLLVVYELRLKATGLPGNTIVAALGGSLLLLGGLAVGPFAPTLPLMLIAAVAHLGRELIKDAQDAAADTATRQTFAVRHGARAAALAGAVSLLAAVVLSPLPHLLAVPGWGNAYLVSLIPVDLTFLAAAVVARRAPREAQTLAKLGMALALAAFTVGALAP